MAKTPRIPGESIKTESPKIIESTRTLQPTTEYLTMCDARPMPPAVIDDANGWIIPESFDTYSLYLDGVLIINDRKMAV